MYMINRSGPSIDHCGTPHRVTIYNILRPASHLTFKPIQYGASDSVRKPLFKGFGGLQYRKLFFRSRNTKITRST